MIVNDTKENLLANAFDRVYDKYSSELNSTAASEGLLARVLDHLLFNMRVWKKFMMRIRA